MLTPDVLNGSVPRPLETRFKHQCDGGRQPLQTARSQVKRYFLAHEGLTLDLTSYVVAGVRLTGPRVVGDLGEIKF
jgi:hypothetical protein